MAWGVFKKIKDGLIKVGNKIKSGAKKAWTGIKKAAGWVNEKIIQPLAPSVSQALMQSGDPKLMAIGSGVMAGSAVFGNVINALNKNNPKGAVTALRDIPGMNEKLGRVSDSELMKKLKPFANMASNLVGQKMIN